MTNDATKRFSVGRSPVTVGRYTYGFENMAVKQWNEGAALRIGAFCSISTNITVFLGGNHRTDWMTTFPFGHVYQDELGGMEIEGHPATKGDVDIGNDVWIGAGVTIMSGVSIGDGAVLSANANIVKDVLPYEIVGGNPAKQLKMRFPDDIIDGLLVLRWWELPVDVIRSIQRVLCTPAEKAVVLELVRRYRTT